MMKIKSLFLAAIFVASTAVAVMAQDAPAAKPGITPYASLRVFLGANYTMPEEGDGDLDMLMYQGVASRMGLKFMGDKLSGQVELGLQDRRGAVNNGNGVYMRHFFVNYKSGDLGVLIGQTETPGNFVSMLQTEDFYGIGYGASYYDRVVQLKFSYQGLYLDFVQPESYAKTAPLGDVPADNYDTYMPTIYVGYDYKDSMMSIGLGGCYVKVFAATEGVDDIEGYMGYVHGQINVAPAYIRFNATYQKDPTALGMRKLTVFSSTHVAAISADYAGLGSDDAVFEGFLEVGTKEICAMVGYARNLDNDADRLAAGLQYTIALESYLKVLPSVLYINDLKDAAGDDQDAEILASIKVQADI